MREGARKNGSNLNPKQVEHYLNYVHQEEEKGVFFAEVKELMEDITDFTKESVFY